MFFHNLKYALKTLFKNKMLLFWTYAFPILLGSFFYLAFSDIEKSETLEVFPIAIVKSEAFEENSFLQEAFKKVSEEESEDQLFTIQYVDLEKAQELLDKEEIEGYIEYKEEPKITIKSNGIHQTILKTVVDEIVEQEKIYEIEIKEEMAKANGQIDANFYASISEKIASALENKNAIKDISSSHLSYTMIEFYTLIAMTCLYGGILGCVAINQTLANMSSNGKRVSISATKKVTLIASSVLASYIAQLIGVFLLFLYTIFVLKVDYGEHLALTILLASAGCLAGLSIGIAVSSLLKTNENVKTGIIIAITMVGCFFSGMMGITMKYIIDKNLPILNKINPANMITDGFYSLYYYDTLSRFFFNFVSLLLFSFLLLAISTNSLRRQKYDSI